MQRLLLVGLLRPAVRFTVAAPGVRSVWHSGYMDLAAASETAKDIRRLLLKRQLRESHPELAKTDIVSLDEELSRLQEEYRHNAGEEFDVHSHNNNGDDTLSEAESLEVELQILLEEVQTLEEHHEHVISLKRKIQELNKEYRELTGLDYHP